MAKLGLGIIGLGMASAPHARALQALSNRVDVIAAYSPTPRRRSEFGAAYGFPTVETVDAVFDDPRIQAVLVLTPPNTHLDLVRRAAAAGKHVLLEKPLEITLERSKALVEAAEQAGITLGVVFQNRFRPGMEAFQNLVDEGRLGRLIGASAQVRFWRPQSYYDEPGRGTLERDGGGVLLTQAIHTLDLLIALAGSPAVLSAYAATSPVHEMETEDIVAAALRYENGALGTISATTAAFPGFPESIEYIGEHGTALLTGSVLNAKFHDGSEIVIDPPEHGSGTGADPMAFPHQFHQALLEDFIEAVESGRPPRIPGSKALLVHELIAQILASSERQNK